MMRLLGDLGAAVPADHDRRPGSGACGETHRRRVPGRRARASVTQSTRGRVANRRRRHRDTTDAARARHPGLPGGCCAPTASYTPRMIPLRDVIPSRTRPVVTVALIALNARSLPAIEQTLGRRQLERFVRTWGLVPAALLPATWSPRCSCTAAGCTSSATCCTCGSSATTSRTGFGHGRFLFFYLLCGAAAALLQVAFSAGSRCRWWAPAAPSPACWARYLVMFPRSRVLTLVPDLRLRPDHRSAGRASARLLVRPAVAERRGQPRPDGRCRAAWRSGRTPAASSAGHDRGAAFRRPERQRGGVVGPGVATAPPSVPAGGFGRDPDAPLLTDSARIARANSARDLHQQPLQLDRRSPRRA